MLTPELPEQSGGVSTGTPGHMLNFLKVAQPAVYENCENPSSFKAMWFLTKKQSVSQPER